MFGGLPIGQEATFATAAKAEGASTAARSSHSAASRRMFGSPLNVVVRMPALAVSPARTAARALPASLPYRAGMTKHRIPPSPLAGEGRGEGYRLADYLRRLI